jgi:predicted DNA-binding mobile mystery protein A
MQTHRSVARQRLDRRLAGLPSLLGPPPPRGWIREIRDALGMSAFEMAGRMGITPSRVSQLERAERKGSIQLSTLERAAAALQCTLRYALVPSEPLEDMVLRQAYDKAAMEVAGSAPHRALLVDEALHADDPSSRAEEVSERIEDLAHELIDRRGLWRLPPADERPP